MALDTVGEVDHSSYARNPFTEVDGKCIGLDGFRDGEVGENSCRWDDLAERVGIGVWMWLRIRSLGVRELYAVR